MTKEAVAIIALGLSLIAAVFGFGVRIGTLTERIETQSKQLDQLGGKVDALVTDFNGTRLELMRLMTSHVEPRPR